MAIDGDWFRARHRAAGVSQSEAARRLGKSPQFFTRVYEGRQQLRLDEASALAAMLGAELSEVLARAGLAAPAAEALRAADWAPRGYEKADVAPAPADPLPPKAQGPHQTVWRVRSRALAAAGYLPGDRIVVDSAVAPRRGDAVLAELRDGGREPVALLRLSFPPWLTRPGLEPEAPLAVDHDRVIVRGVVVAQWRVRGDAAP